MPTLGYGGVAYGGQIEAIAAPTTQMTSQGRPNNGNIQMLNPNDQGNVNSTPVNSTGGTETRPLNVALLPIIKS
jgi:hypothetical protein